MQFIENGPDIPNALLQAHEDGKVIFFCGAGISYPAGLPGFQGLVDKIFQEVGTQLNPIERRAYDNRQYDVTLDLLERRHPGKRVAVRAELYKILKPKLRRKGALDTHKALLELARDRNGDTRLVTTNFDYIFQHLIKKSKSTVNIYKAPLLPIPKNSRWNGVVHLHGLISDSTNKSELNNLVLTSGDFGLAYLTERWAARFVSELFRTYIVCFIGYSINDMVIRYMMDALAADRLLGETTLQAYALGTCEPGQENNDTEEWVAKGVIPILYEVPADTNDHSTLHRTLKTWAEIYRDGVQGKERIVIDYAITQPSFSTQQDNFIGRMLWALSDQSGMPAKRFAEHDPVPSIKWLEILNDNCFCTDDLVQFGILHHREQDKNVEFSLLRRPANQTKASWMSLVSSENNTCQLDDVMLQLGHWLIRHLNEPELVLWVAKYGGRLHDQFAHLIEEQLNKLARLEREKNVTELDRIRGNAPNAIPNRWMRTLWRLILSGLIKSHWYSNDLFRWKNHLERDGFTVMLRLELRKILAPKIILNKPYKWDVFETEAEKIQKPKQLVDYELTLTADHVTSTLESLKQSEIWLNIFPELIDEFQQLLLDTLDISRELGKADILQDGSYHHLPSISPHWQNRGFHDWVALIELVRDAWIAIYKTNLRRAMIIVQNWLALPYPTFRRLVFFAATYQDIASDGKWVSWLLENDGLWLWSVEVQRETLRLLVLQGNKLSDAPRKKLEAAILSGPPRDMFVDNIDSKEWQRIVDKETWLRLAKLNSSGCQLTNNARTQLSKLSKKYPNWKLANNEQDEFPFWICGTGDPDFEEQKVLDRAPCKRSDLVKWLESEKTSHFFYEDNWSEICRSCFSVSACALIELARKNKWPVGYWRSALHTWSNEKELTQRSWRYIAPTLKNIPDNELLDVVKSVAWWLEVSAKSLKQHEEIFLVLCKRILGLQYQDSIDKERITMQAINHPVGQVTQALLRFWLRRKPNDNDGLPNDMKPLFSSLFNKKHIHYRYARVILASNLITLFRVDEEWTNEFLLPCFNWEVNTEEALAVWEGFLWSPRLYKPLLSAFKAQFLETAKHYSELDGDYGRQYSTFLTYIALEDADTLFTQAELQTTFMDLPTKGLEESASAMTNALNSAGEQRENYWKNRIEPFWKKIWPKFQSSTALSIAKPLARLVIAAGNKFPEAMDVIQYWLQSIEHPHYVVNLLQQSNLCKQFPEDALNYLDKIMSYNFYPPEELKQCLEDIKMAWSGAQTDLRYIKMTNYLQKYNQ